MSRQSVSPGSEHRITSAASSLNAVFSGDDRRHGTYDHARLRLVGDKIEMKDEAGQGPRDIIGPATESDWVEHLRGVRPLGVRPVRADGTARWGVIDVDVYDLDVADLVERVSAHRLPLVLCLSKSRGGHLFLFLRQWVRADRLHRALSGMAATLGLTQSAEVFPPTSSDGNWLNMPYFGGESTERYAVKAGGLAMTVGEFLDSADRSAIDDGDLDAFARDGGSLRAVSLDDGLARLAQWIARLTSAPRGQANKILAAGAFDLGRYSRDVALDAGEAEREMRLAWAQRKPREEPEFDAVWSRQFGAGAARGRAVTLPSGVLPVFERVLREVDSEEVTFHLQIEGKEVRVAARDLADQRRFNVASLAQIGRMFEVPKDRNAWTRLVNEAVAVAETVEAEAGLGEADEFREIVGEFVTNRHRGETRDEILLGRPWHDDATGRHLFKMESLARHLKIGGSRFATNTRKQLGQRIRALGGDKSSLTIKGKTVDAFWVPASQFQPTPLLPVPPVPSEPL